MALALGRSPNPSVPSFKQVLCLLAEEANQKFDVSRIRLCFFLNSTVCATRSWSLGLTDDSIRDEGTFLAFETHLSDQLRLESATEVAKRRLVNEDATLGSLVRGSELVLVQTFQPRGDIHRVAYRRVLHPLGTA